MNQSHEDARRVLGNLVAQVERPPESPNLHLLSPRVGLWRGAPRVGHVLAPDQSIGELEVLGRRFRLRVPPQVAGRVVEVADPGVARKAMQWGEVLLVLDPRLHDEALAEGDPASSGARERSGNWLESPSSGRFYRRASPDQPPFVSVGDTIALGDTFGLLEVMKTFTRLQFQNPNLPARAKVVEIAADDGDEVDLHAPLLRWEALD